LHLHARLHVHTGLPTCHHPCAERLLLHANLLHANLLHSGLLHGHHLHRDCNLLLGRQACCCTAVGVGSVEGHTSSGSSGCPQWEGIDGGRWRGCPGAAALDATYPVQQKR
jgi:hypothetical protein